VTNSNFFAKKKLWVTMVTMRVASTQNLLFNIVANVYVEWLLFTFTTFD